MCKRWVSVHLKNHLKNHTNWAYIRVGWWAWKGWDEHERDDSTGWGAGAGNSDFSGILTRKGSNVGNWVLSKLFARAAEPILGQPLGMSNSVEWPMWRLHSCLNKKSKESRGHLQQCRIQERPTVPVTGAAVAANSGFMLCLFHLQE